MPNSGQVSAPRITAPAVSLPAGGGAVRGLGESFESQDFTGSANFSVPIPAPEARGVSPEASLSYSSGGGNGVFGMGFTLSLSSIARKTNDGIPRYTGDDAFVISDHEELVPALVFESGKWVAEKRRETQGGSTWEVQTYKPRLESAFDRIERWTSLETIDSYWRVLTRDNLIHYYGRTSDARIFDPEDRRRVFQWLIEETLDPLGNKILYHYRAEDEANLQPEIYEVDRDYRSNRYISTIEYGNYFIQGTEHFAFRVVFDYGEFQINDPGAPPGTWTVRPDPFSSYRSGFEVRTLRRCDNILIYNCFHDQFDGKPFLTRALSLRYRQGSELSASPQAAPNMSFVETITEIGFRRELDGSYTRKALPSLELNYSKFNPQAQTYKKLEVDGGLVVPGYLAGGQYLSVDLQGEGLPGLLYSDGTTTLLWEPQGDGRYSAPQNPDPFPIENDLSNPEIEITSLAGNGEPDLVVRSPARSGFYQFAGRGAWNPFRPFESTPVDIANPVADMVDMDGDGRADLVVFQMNQIRSYPSLGYLGFGPPDIVEKQPDFPAPAQSAPEEVVTFADMFGDGLSHRVRIRNGLVECWPNLGYGRFGAKVVLGNAPDFGGKLDVSRVQLSDLDGSGTTDIIYVDQDQIQIYFNQCGNTFSEPLTIQLPAPYDELSQVTFADINGNGTSCLILTRLTPEVTHYFYDFAGDLKPYLLTEIDNHLGATTRIQYTTSVKQYLEDKQAGRQWATQLYFPVQVVEKVEHFDEVCRTRHATKHKYHDGYYDPVEREFRGFGFIETWDTEDFEEYAAASQLSEVSLRPVEEGLYVPPAYIRAWYHTGAFLDASVISSQYEHEYWNGDPRAYELPENEFDPAIYEQDQETLRQAYAALAGQLLRQEVFGLDETPEAVNPYTVTESSVKVRFVQPRTALSPAIFFTYPLERLSYHYERNPVDPRVQHDFTLLVDEFGNMKRTCVVAYPRRLDTGHAVFPGQDELKIVVSEQEFINHVETSAEPYRWIGVNCESRDYELAGLNTLAYFTFDELARQAGEALRHRIAYGQPFTPGEQQARLFSWNRTYQWNEALTDVLPLRKIASRGLRHHVEVAVLTPELVQTALQDKLTPAQLSADAGYSLDEGYWWNRGLIQHYFKEPERFFLPSQVDAAFAGVDPLGHLNPITTVAYDVYNLMPVETTEYVEGSPDSAATPLVLTTRIDNDYRALSPRRLSDPNDNVTEILFDPLGLVTVTTIFGTEGGKPVGDDRLAAYQPQLEATFADVITNPQKYLQRATTFLFYDLQAWSERHQPAATVSLVRHTHVHDLRPGEASQIKIRIIFADGFGQVIESKLQTEPGWIVSERTIYNNKNKPAKEYLPWLSPTPDYESQPPLEPPPTVFFYDPLQRVIRTDTPKRFFTKAEFSPWEVKTYDEDDTVKESDFFRNFFSHPITPDKENERDALVKAAAFFNTPSVTVLDNLGRPIRRLQDNLGAVRPAAFDKIVEGHPITPQQLWDKLVADGYLRGDVQDPTEAWVTEKLQPYDVVFQQTFREQFETLAAPILELLKSNGLTTAYELDIAGHEIRSTDPRLFYSNVTQGTEYHNFIYLRDMLGSALATNGADTGLILSLADIFDGAFWSFSARNFEQIILYDRLQRRSKVRVKGFKNDGTLVSDNLVEVFTYGETQSQSENFNLRGELYELQDQSGLVRNTKYSFQGDLQETTRRFSVDYKNVLNWAVDVPLEPEPETYKTEVFYNALRLPVAEITPDGSTIRRSYNLGGLLDRVEVTYTDGSQQPLVNQILYNANEQRLAVVYANGVTTTYEYEDSTLRLLKLSTVRAGQSGLQDISYTYDPVGNVTRTFDATYQTVFHNNQAVQPLSDYTYDAVYRLVKANGRQHPGINAATYRNNKKDGDFKQSKYYSLPNDTTALENYAENYAYDDAGNLLTTKHVASNSWTRSQEIMSDSNRLKTIGASNGISYSFPIPYDKSGNQTQLDINNPVSLSWNCCENLVSARIIERPDQPDDSDYYTYDSEELRTRKVSERMANGGSVIQKEVKIYLGDYEVTLLKRETQAGEITVLERQSVRVIDDQTPIAIIDFWAQDELKREVNQPGTRIVRYQLNTQLDSIAMEVNGDAQLISYEEYFPYGGTAFIAGRNELEVSLKVYRYSGKDCDDSTGLYYYGQRYYVSWLGRWLKPDPLGTIDGLNLYAFVGGNPITSFDVGGTAKLRHSDMNKRSQKVGRQIAEELKKGKGPSKKKLEDIGEEARGTKRKRSLSVQKDATVDIAVAAALTGDKSTGAKRYRAAEAAMDEFASTATVTNMSEGAGEVSLSTAQTAQFTMAIRVLSEARMPTSQVGHSISSGEVIQHPTSASSALWGSSGKNHGRMDLARRDVVLSAAENSPTQGAGRIIAMQTASIEYTLNQVASPPFASNNSTRSGTTSQQLAEAHEYREAQKELYRLLKSEKAPKPQSRSSQWKPDPKKRGVSPPRKGPP